MEETADGIKVCKVKSASAIIDQLLMLSHDKIIWYPVEVPVKVNEIDPIDVYAQWPHIFNESSNQRVTLYGSNFRNDLTLKINGVSTEYGLVSSRELSVPIQVNAEETVDEFKCKQEGTIVCLGQVIDMPYAFVIKNPISNGETVLYESRIVF